MLSFIIIFSSIIFLFCFYMVYLAHHDTIDYRTIYDESLPADFKGFRIFFISDIHRRNIRSLTLDTIKNDEIDIIIIGGDLTEKGVPLRRTLCNIKKLKQWQRPMYFVWGNNDYEANPQELYNLLTNEGVTILTNDNKDISGKNGQKLSLLGLDCCKYGEVRFDKAIHNAKGDYHIVITHSPIAFYELEYNEKNKIHTVLSGHTHGGQIRLFGFGLYSRGGINVHQGINVFVSEGYGYTRLPFRLGTRAECHVLTFEQDHL